MINLNDILAQMLALITKTYADKWPLVKDSVNDYFTHAKERFANLAQMLADGVDMNHIMILLTAEKEVLLQQLQTLEVITLKTAQDLVNEVMDIFSEIIPILPVENDPTDPTDSDPLTDSPVPTGPLVPTVTETPTTNETETPTLLSDDEKKNKILDMQINNEAAGKSEQETQNPKQETISPYAAKKTLDARFHNFQADPVYGVCFADESDIDVKINVAKMLGAKAIRMTISLDNYNGKSAAFEKIDAAGFGVYLNVYNHSLNDVNGTRIPQPFPTGEALEIYRKKLAALLDKYRPKILFVENEELVNLFHSGEMPDYTAQVAVTIIEAHMRGILVSNGGLTNPWITILAYRSLLNDGRVDDAKLLLNTAMDTRIAKACTYPNSNPDVEAKTAQAAFLILAFSRMGIDFVNFHWYEYLKSYKRIDDGQSTTGAMKLVVEYLQTATGKKVICNEMGQHNDNASLTASMLQDVKDCNLKLMIWFSATSRNGATFPLNDGLKLNACGNAYKEFVK